jgi:hypothetical protein
MKQGYVVVKPVCHLLEVSRVCGFLLHFVQLSMRVSYNSTNSCLVRSIADIFYSNISNLSMRIALNVVHMNMSSTQMDYLEIIKVSYEQLCYVTR